MEIKKIDFYFWSKLAKITQPALVEMVLFLQEQVRQLMAEQERLNNKISANSSKTPSYDELAAKRLKRKRSIRESTERSLAVPGTSWRQCRSRD